MLTGAYSVWRSIGRNSCAICPVAMFVTGVKYHGRSSQPMICVLATMPRAMVNCMNRNKPKTSTVSPSPVIAVPVRFIATAAAAKTIMVAIVKNGTATNA